MSELSPVSFHGDTIFCVELDGQPYAPMRPIVENMGLDWSAQYRKLIENKERWGVAIIATPSEGGEQETICMPVRKLPAWLASINPKKVKAELRPKIELYQAECDDVLWDYWAKGNASRPSPQPTAAPTGIRSVQDLYALRKAQYQHLPEKEKSKTQWRIDRRLRKYFGTGCLSEIPQDQWQKAAKLIALPFQKQGSFGLVRKMGQTPAQFTRPVPISEIASAPLHEVLDTLEDMRKKCEQCLHYIYQYKGNDFTDCRFNMLSRLKLHSFDAMELTKNLITTMCYLSRT